jgi:hypothetical protein
VIGGSFAIPRCGCGTRLEVCERPAADDAQHTLAARLLELVLRTERLPFRAPRS